MDRGATGLKPKSGGIQKHVNYIKRYWPLYLMLLPPILCMGPALAEKRDVLLTQSVVAAPEDFDSVFDSGLNDYLSSGGQAIIDERITAWERVFGDVTEMPD